jgi:hypothetical protein
MDDISPDFNTSKPLEQKAEDELNPQIVELVKLLARICAKRDYNRLLTIQKMQEGAEP